MDTEKLVLELQGNQDAFDVLQEAIATEERKHDDTWLGAEWFDLHASPQLLNHLVRIGLLNIAYKSNKSTHYRVNDLARAKRVLKAAMEAQEPMVEQELEVPKDLFDVIILQDAHKQLLTRVLGSKEPVHALLSGDVSSAKTLFLLELARLPGSEYVLASSLTKAGLYDLMFAKKPRYLLIDELDKLSDYENTSALLSLMETGILSEVKYRRRRQQTFKTWIFGGCNYEDRIPQEILSRFGAYRLRFRQYTPEEYLEVAARVLEKREGLAKELAQYIAKETSRRLLTRDVRVARSVARTVRTREDVDSVISLLEKEGRR